MERQNENDLKNSLPSRNFDHHVSHARAVASGRPRFWSRLFAVLLAFPALIVSQNALAYCPTGYYHGFLGQRTFTPGETLILCEDDPYDRPLVENDWHVSSVSSQGFPFPGPYDYSDALSYCALARYSSYTATGTVVSECYVVEAEQGDLGFLHPEEFRVTPIPTYNVPVVRFLRCNHNDTARPSNQSIGCEVIQWTWTNPETCQAGGSRDPATGVCLPPPEPQDDKGSGNGSPSEPPSDVTPSSSADLVPRPPVSPCVGNPCNPANGNKYMQETDYQSPATGVSLTRSYNSRFQQDVGFGFGWISSAQAQLEIGSTDPSMVQVRRSDGRGEPFICSLSVGTCQGHADTLLTLSKDASGYLLTRAQGVSERYDTAGRLTERTEASGERLTYGYDTQGRLATITGPYGHVLSFFYDPSGHVSTVNDPAGQAYGYLYDVAGNLIRVTYPDGRFKIYHYEDSRYPHHLTGITDELGVRFATYAYDYFTGRATLTQHAVTDNGAPQERFTLSYTGDTETRVQDAVGTIQTMTFQSHLGVKTLVSQSNSFDIDDTITQTVDANNNITCRRDQGGNVTTYQYNATNQLINITEALSGDCLSPVSTDATRYASFQYLSPNTNLPTVIQGPSVAAGHTQQTLIQYSDPAHPALPTAIIKNGFTAAGTPVSRRISYAYNANGQLAQIDGSRTDVNDVTTLEYYVCNTGGACGKLRRLANAIGQATTYDNYDAHGRLTQVTDPNGVRTNYVYDQRGRVRFVTQTPPAGIPRTTEYRYDAAGQMQTAITPDGITLTYLYDAAHYLRSVTDNLGNRIAYHYDVKGNRDRVDITDPFGALARTVRQTYDQRNHVTSISLGGITMNQRRDALGNLVQEYDANRLAPTDHSYDALNRLRQTVDRLSGVTGYAYDVQNNPTVVQSPNGATTQYVYDDLGNRLQELSPDRGTITYGYDAAGNVISQLDARGVLVNYQYDALNRVTSMDYPGTSEDVSFVYDSGPSCSFGAGRLCSQTDASGSTAYGYDAFGNLTSQIRTVGGVSIGFQYTYDSGNRLLTITYPDGSIVTYERDALGRVSGVNRTAAGATTTLLSNRQYQADGLMISQTYGNGLTDTRSYDQRGLLLDQSLGAVYTRQYVYDSNGNLIRNPDPADAEYNVGRYEYDRLDRLFFIDLGSEYNEFSYDENGNRTGDLIYSYGYVPGTNRLDYVVYDNAGNILDGGDGNTYTYSNAGRLAQAMKDDTLVATYTYNAQGQRTKKTLPNGMNVLYHYSPTGQLLAETDAQGRLAQAYILVDDLPIARFNYDRDYDGTPDGGDNCLNLANPNQRDTNGDGNGNLCDPDLNNDGIVNNTDVNRMKQVFYTNNADADLNGDGYVNFGDLAILKSMFNQPPGPGAQAAAPTLVYLYTDAIGNLRLATDVAGQAVWSNLTDVFGNTPPNEDVDGDDDRTMINWRSLGLYADNETGLLYNGARYRNPIMNRFITADPRSVAEHLQRWLTGIGLPNLPPLEINPYVAVLNSPLRWIDPEGFAGGTSQSQLGRQGNTRGSAERSPFTIAENQKTKSFIDYLGNIAEVWHTMPPKIVQPCNRWDCNDPASGVCRVDNTQAVPAGESSAKCRCISWGPMTVE